MSLHAQERTVFPIINRKINGYKEILIKAPEPEFPKFPAPFFNTSSLLWDIDKDGKKDFLSALSEVTLNGKNYKLPSPHLKQPFNIYNKGGFKYLFDFSNQNKDLYWGMQCAKLVDLNNDGIPEIFGISEHLHMISVGAPQTYVDQLYEYFKINNIIPGVDFKANTEEPILRYYSISKNSIVDQKSKLNYQNLTNPPFQNSGSYSIGDIDNDGDIDLVTRTQDPNKGRLIEIWNNDGKGNFNIARQNFDQYFPHEAEDLLYDIDKDGFLDLITNIGNEYLNLNGTVDRKFRLGYLKNNKNLSFKVDSILWIDTTLRNDIAARNIYVQDINNDGKKELIVFFAKGFAMGTDLLNTETKNIQQIRIYNIDDINSITDITDKFFSNNENILKINAPSVFLNLIDIDNDGIMELVPKFEINEFAKDFQGYWNNNPSFQYFKLNKNIKFEIIKAEFDDGAQKKSNSYDVKDIDDDGLPEFIWVGNVNIFTPAISEFHGYGILIYSKSIKPQTPEILKVFNDTTKNQNLCLSSDSLVIKFEQNAKFDEFSIQFSKDSNFSSPKLYDTIGNQLIINNLGFGKFFYRARIIYNLDTSDYSSVHQINLEKNPQNLKNIDTSFCQGTNLTSLNLYNEINTYWYTTAIGGISSKNQPSISSDLMKSYTFYATIKDTNSCESKLRSVINIQIKETPSFPILSRDSLNNLISSYQYKNTWYKDGVAITDTTQKIKPTTPGSYTVKTTQNGCISAASTPYYYLVTDIINLSADEFIKLAPNPFTNQLNFDFVLKGYQKLNLEVFDLATGAKVSSLQSLSAGMPIYLGQLSAGTYVIKVSTGDNKIVQQFKVVKL